MVHPPAVSLSSSPLTRHDVTLQNGGGGGGPFSPSWIERDLHEPAMNWYNAIAELAGLGVADVTDSKQGLPSSSKATHVGCGMEESRRKSGTRVPDQAESPSEV